MFDEGIRKKSYFGSNDTQTIFKLHQSNDSKTYNTAGTMTEFTKDDEIWMKKTEQERQFHLEQIKSLFNQVS